MEELTTLRKQNVIVCMALCSFGYILFHSCVIHLELLFVCVGKDLTIKAEKNDVKWLLNMQRLCLYEHCQAVEYQNKVDLVLIESSMIRNSLISGRRLEDNFMCSGIETNSSLTLLFDFQVLLLLYC